MTALLHGPLPLFIAQAVLIVVAARLLGLLARRVGQPMVIAEITAGIVLGPSLLGWLFPAFSAAMFPKESMPLLGMMSQIGLVLFMFLIGLELDPKLLRGRAQTSIAISHSSIVLPFALGALLALHLLETLKPAGVPVSSFVLFMGAAMSITAFPVLARILVERRLLKTRIGAITIACAAVNDVTAWCILAFVVSVARSTNVGGAVRTTLLTLGYVGAMVWIVQPLLQRLAERSRVGLTQNLVAVVLVLLLLSAWTTELIGIHALFGAFMLGAMLPKQGAFAAALAEKIEDLVVVFFLPLFFAYSGLHTQVGLLSTPGAWLTCALVIGVACLGKFGGSTLAARLTGIPWREASAVGILMNTRGLIELIVLNIGLDLGVISPTLFTMMVVMALVTTFMTTPLLAVVYPVARLVRELAEPVPSLSPTAPKPYTALVCVSFERSGPGLVTLGAAIAGTDDAQSRLYALRLVAPTDRASFVLGLQTSAEPSEPEGPLDALLERARDLDVKVRPLSFVSGNPARDICDVAQVKRADIVLLGWNRPLFGTAMLAGTVHDVMTGTPSDVGVLVDRGLEKIARVLVPYLGSEHDRAALGLARRIAENTGAAVTILHIVSPERSTARLGAEQRAQEEFAHEEGTKRRYTVTFQAVPHTVPAEAVVEESTKGYDLVLVGVGKEWGLEHRLFGLQPETILAQAHTSVLVVRRGTEAQGQEARAEAPRAELATVP